MRRSFLAVLLAPLACAAACASLEGLSGTAPDLVPPGDAGAEASPPSVDAGVTDPCRHRVLPPDPGTDDDPAGDVGSLVLAVRAYSNQGALDGGKPVGFDLDGVCSCFPDPATARGGKPSCIAAAGASPTCDGDGGTDNELSNLVAAYPTFAAARTGDLPGPTLLLVLNRYNGRANDNEVFLAVLPSPGIFDSRCGSMEPGVDAGAPPFTPKWKGCDRWDVDPEHVLPSSLEPIAFLRGVVVDHLLVVRSGSKSATFQLGAATLPLDSAVLSARLVAVDEKILPIQPQPQVGKLFRLQDAVVGGRAPVRDLLRATATSMATSGGGPLCGFPQFFNAVKSRFICPAADLMRTSDQDFTERTCDALSLASSFTAEPAQLGERRAPAAPECKDPASPDVQDFFDCAK